MKIIADIIALHGGLGALAADPITIDPPSDGFMRLSIELVGTGPDGFPLVSVAHYYEQNGDLVADPEMTFQVLDDESNPCHWRAGKWFPVSFEMPGMGIHRRCTWLADDGRVMVSPREQADQRSFARTWGANIRRQDFLAAFKRQRAGVGSAK